MKVQLRDHVRVNGDTTRAIDAARVDWAKRIVLLDDGRWVPFENVLIGDAPVTLSTTEDVMRFQTGGLVKINDEVRHLCTRCSKLFATPQSLGGHRRHCKGATQ